MKTSLPRPASFSPSALLLVPLSLACLSPVGAQNFTEWTGSGSNWNDSGNWIPASTPDVRYGQLDWKGNGNQTSNNTYSNLSMSRLYFSGTKAYTLTGNAINLFDYTVPDPDWFSWVLSDSTVAQTFSTLDVNFAATQGATFGQISARNSGNLTFRNIGITGSQIAELRITGQGSGRVIFKGVISGSGKNVVVGLREDGVMVDTGSHVVFEGDNTYSGTTTIRGGTLQLGAGAGTGSTGSGNINFTGGQVLLINRSDAPSFANSIALGASGTSRVNIASGTSATLNGAITTTGAEFWKQGAGELTVGNAGNAFTTSVVIEGGTLTTALLSNAGSNSPLGKGGIFLGAGGGTATLKYTGATATTDRIGASALQGAANTIEVTSGAAALTVSTSISELGGSRPLTKTGAGDLVLTAANGFSGATTVSAGRLQAGAAGALQSTSGITVNTGGTLLLGGTGDRIGNSVPVALSGGTFQTGGLSEGTSTASGLGALSSSTATSVIDFGTSGGSVIAFNSIASVSATLSVWNWTSGSDRFFVTTGSAGSYSQVNFYTGAESVNAIGGGGASLISIGGGNFELVPVPEPGALFAGLALLAPLAWRERRHWMRCAAAR